MNNQRVCKVGNNELISHIGKISEIIIITNIKKVYLNYTVIFHINLLAKKTL